VAEVFDILARLPVPCVLLVGNHDVHDAAGIYRRHATDVSRAGVHFLDDEKGSTLELFDGALTLWGKAMDEHSPTYRPLHGVAEPPDTGWYVVLGHGHYVGEVPPEKEMRSSPITSADIAATRADYVALGHWHVTTEVSEDGVAAWYPGSPVQSWSDGVALLVDLDPARGVAVSSLPIELPEGACR
jgi:DNA repair exonuclease SbcCD nuclease subunit